MCVSVLALIIIYNYVSQSLSTITNSYVVFEVWNWMCSFISSSLVCTESSWKTESERGSKSLAAVHYHRQIVWCVCACMHACVHVCACVCVCVHTCTNYTLLDVYGHHSCFCTCSTCSLLPTLSLLGLRQSVKRVHELETLSNSLSEEVKEKSLALAHQKRTNKSVLCA